MSPEEKFHCNKKKPNSIKNIFMKKKYTLIAFLFLKYSRKIPIRQLFRYSSWVIILLALILTGKGTHSLQEAGWLSVTGFLGFTNIDWLGVYPTVETLTSQIALLSLMLVLYHFSNTKNKFSFK